MPLGKTMGHVIDEWATAAARQWRRPSWWNLLIVLPWSLGMVLCIHGWRVDRAIALREQISHGVITSHDPQNHNQYGYVFTVAGKSYTGWDSPANEFEIGQAVTVYYDPLIRARTLLLISTNWPPPA